MKESIVYIGFNFPDKSPAGIRALANAKALKEYGYNVALISRNDEKQDLSIEECYGMRVWHILRPLSNKEWMKSLVSVKQYIEILNKIDNVKTVVAYELPAICLLKLRKYCNQNGILLISEVGEWQSWKNLGHLGIGGRLIRLTDINFAIRYAYKKSDALIVTSHYFKDYFNGIVPTLVLPTLQFNKSLFTDEISVNSPRRFIYAGGIGYQKDMLSDIIHAFGRLPNKDYEFHVVGMTLEQYLTRFPKDENLIKRLNSSGIKIYFKGRVSHSEVLEEIKAADFSLVIRESSRRNNMGSPTKFGESINCGTPVVVSDFSDVVRYTQEYHVGVITDVNRIEDGINTALEMDDNSLKEMKKRCRECDAFNYKGHVKELGEFVKRLER